MTRTTNHNKAAVRRMVSEPIMAYVGHISWQLLMVTLVAASADPVVLTLREFLYYYLINSFVCYSVSQYY